MNKKVMLVFGTRPEAIKMCPLVKELKNRKNIETIVCVTGQHREMLHQVLNVFDVVPDYDLDIMKEKQSLFDVTINILERIKSVLEKEHPDIVLVHGDTSTTFVTALACFYLHIAIGHVEAGLRTYNLESPWPEEFNRQAVSIVSKYNFCPTELSRQNLLNEGKEASSIFITGNTAIDALKTTIKDNYYNENLEWAKGSRLIMLTAHRRENLGKPMENMFRAIKRIVDEHDDVKVIYTIHMNPAVREIAKVRDDHNKLVKTTTEILLLHLCLTFLGYIVVCIMAFCVDKVSVETPLFLLLSTSLLFTALGCEWFYQGMEDFKYITMRALFVRCISVILLFIKF